MHTLTVARRYCGPTSSANGGYIAGLIAAHAPFDVTVRLLQPPPLDTALLIEQRDGLLEVRDGERTVAQARPGSANDLLPPALPGFEQAAEAASRYPGYRNHPAPFCFVCGPQRAPGDGLRLFPGAIESAGVVATVWRPDASLDGGDGCIGLPFMWAALDCPGYHAVAADVRPMLLGEITASVDRRLRVGEPCIVIGWTIASRGRKHEAGTAIAGADGVTCARARAVWIEPRQDVEAGSA